MWWIGALLGVGLLMLAIGFVISRRADQSFVERRLGIAEERAVQTGVDERKSPITDAFNRALASRGVGANIATQLARANLKFTVGEFIALDIILVIAFGAAAFVLRGGDLILTAIAALVGFFAPWIYVTLRRGQRLKAFNDQLSDTLNLMVNSIRAGYSVMQAMETVAEEMSPPISEEFGRVVREVQLGLTLEQALDNMLRRITSDDLDMMITAVKVQREVGGNLAEVLDSISYTIRERIRIKGDIQSLTAYGRGAGNLLTAVPIILSVIIYLITPDFMSQLIEDPCGWMMLGVAVLGIILGYIIIRKIVDIDV